MEMSISFPNLGIYLDHVGKTITVFGVEIAYYGMIIAAGMLLAIWYVVMEAKRTNQNQDFYLDMALISIVVGVIGARVYYVAFAWDSYKDNLLEIFNTRNGGLAIYGGIIFGVGTACLYSRFRKMPLPKVVDTACAGLLIGQILGRWGNFFNREAFGGYTDGLFAMRLPVNAVRESEITAQMWEHVQNIGGVDYIQVHPTFLYESLWNLALLCFLIWYKRRKRFEGEVFLCYLAGYGAGRFWIESLRTDQLLIPGIGFPVSQLLSAVLVIICGTTIIVKGTMAQKRKRMKESKREVEYERSTEAQNGDFEKTDSGVTDRAGAESDK